MIPLIVWLSIVINEVFPAPRQGNEWVELYNASAETIDISGWVIDDDTPGGTRVVFGANTTLAPHTWLVVAMPSAIFNNTGDTVTLSDARGTVIDSLPYTAIDSDTSIARMPDGANTVVLTSAASAGASNTALTPSATPTPTLAATMVISDTTIFTDTATPTITVVHTTDLTSTSTTTPTPTATNTPTKTLSPSKTPSATKTLSPSKTPSATKTLSPSKTPSATKTLSPSKTPSATKTLSPSKTPSATKTLSPSKTPSAQGVVLEQKPARLMATPTIQSWLAVALQAQTPVVIVCHPQGHSLAGWELAVDDTLTHIVDEGTCYTTGIPQTAHLALQNSHQFTVATLDAAAAFCAIDIGTCRPSQRRNTPVLVLEASPTAHATVRVPATHTPAMAIVSAAETPAPPAAPATSLLWIGSLCVAGGVALRMLANHNPDVLYSNTDSDAASTDATVAQRVEDSASSTDDHHEGHR